MIKHDLFVSPIGQLHDDVILLLPESFSLLFSCANYGCCFLHPSGIGGSVLFKCKSRPQLYTGTQAFIKKITANFAFTQRLVY